MKNPAQCPGRRWAGRRGESLIVVDAAPWASGVRRRGPHKQVSLLQGWHFGSVGAARADGAALAHSPHGPIPIRVRADPVIRDPHPPSPSASVRPSVRRDGRHKTLRQRPLCPRKLRITLLFSTRLRSLDRDNQFENRFLTLKLFTPLDVDFLLLSFPLFLSHFQSFLTTINRNTIVSWRRRRMNAKEAFARLTP